jgi:adenylate cyclase
MASEERWRELLTGEAADMLKLRRQLGRLPSQPRCKICNAPYGGLGGLVLRPWFGPWEKNPQLCKACFKQLSRGGVGGAEVEVSMLFADIRGSTGLGERLRPAEFSALLTTFYRIGSDAIVHASGIVDKFVGDEVIGLFVPMTAGHDHAAHAVAAARELLERVGRPEASSSGPIPVGAGVHTGVAFVGTVGSSEEISDFTALGDAVNTTARLASAAKAGELLISVAAAEAAHIRTTGLERRTVEVRGREATLDVFAESPALAAA